MIRYNHSMTQEPYVKPSPLTMKNILLIIFGSACYACAVNLFLQPLNLYAGGLPGLSQILNNQLIGKFAGFNTSGIINLLFNIPLFILAYRNMHKKMLIGTIISVIVQTLCFTLVKIPSTPILSDTLASIMMAGVMGGTGCGIILTNGGSGGGLDLLGVYLTSLIKNFSVGRLSLLFNACLYGYCAVRFDVSVSIYSALFIVFFSLAIDKMHYQNIEVQLMIFTHNDEMVKTILNKYVRGCTEWNGAGAYTKKDTHIYVTVVDKKQVRDIKKDLIEIDPHAFIIENNVTVTGNYQKRLDS